MMGDKSRSNRPRSYFLGSKLSLKDGLECSVGCRSRGGKSPIALKVPIGPRLREPYQQKGLGSEHGQLNGDYITEKKKIAALSTATVNCQFAFLKEG